MKYQGAENERDTGSEHGEGLLHVLPGFLCLSLNDDPNRKVVGVERLDDENGIK